MKFFIIQFIVGFFTVGLRGVQTHNVIHGHYWHAFFTSILMGVSSVAFINFVATDPWKSCVPLTLGSSAGILTAMWYKRRGLKKS